VNQFPEELFSISTEQQFNELALKAFSFQMKNNPVYREFVSLIKTKTEDIRNYKEIPFLPIQFFKSHRVCCTPHHQRIFTSSGTSGAITSTHYIAYPEIYTKSYLNCFEYFFGNPENYCILALLPSYLEREGSSLVTMADDLIGKTKHPLSSFYLHDTEKLKLTLNQLKKENQKTILLGVSYALLDLAEDNIELNENFIVMETGGMKGKRREMIKEELHHKLKNGLGVKTIYSEYGMTELLSQAYSKGEGLYETPSWMKILIREVSDSKSIILSKNTTGALNVIDLANWYSCPFIATQDIGRQTDKNHFEILGRMDNSDIRGCNLMVV